MAEPGFWDRKELAQKQVEEVSTLRNKVGPFLEIERSVDDVGVLKQLADEEPEGDSKNATLAEFGAEFGKVEKLLADFELMQLMSGQNDRHNCFLTIHSGAGGTESCDWADMLLRMYTRWSERARLQSRNDGHPARRRSGHQVRHAQGHAENTPSAICNCERGVHRLVRISPFDSNKRRHTSFCQRGCRARHRRRREHRDQRSRHRSRHLSLRRQRRPEREQSGDRRAHHAHTHAASSSPARPSAARARTA